MEGDTSAPVEWERNIHIVPHFANAFVPADYKQFEVRTLEQLNHVGDSAYRDATFIQTHNIEVGKTDKADDTLQTIDTFEGTYKMADDCELVIHSAPNGWIKNVNYGYSVNLNKLILKDVDQETPIFGTIYGTVSGDAVSVKRDENEGTIQIKETKDGTEWVLE